MNRSWTAGFVLIAVLSAFACSDDAPANPSPTAPRFTAQLLPGNEAPVPVTPPNADATASGTMTLTLNVTRDAAQQITSATGDFIITVTGFPANTTLTGAHIHPGRPGIAGGVIVPVALTASDSALSTGAATITKTAIAIDPVVAQNIINDPIGFYFNVHTTVNAGGAIRGQLARQ